MAPAQIDHVVILLPYKDLINPPAWITENFALTPGGRHSDGRTENKLIVFKDGTYLELIAFINDNPSLRRDHPWGKKHYGFIDFALTTPRELDYAGLRGRINQKSGRLAIDYAYPVDGGRQRPDGVEVKWKVTFPVNQATASPHPSAPVNRRGEIPFWCNDITPRNVRVDTTEENTTHPSGALGIAQFTVLVPKSKVDRYVDLYSSIMDTQPVRVFGTTRLPLDTPIQHPGLVKPWVFVEDPTSEEEKKRVAERGPGIVEIALRVGTEGSVGVARAPISEQGIWIHFLK
ncbi:glyoxalase-like domain-containing protein [Sphaerosporella brunnea]|uniref:Glyoxalase-like domain-containing protein n=1 Tax=Sphaerosporella brunnea TaxID=1250544 RepID=A0A5J5EZF1_9PEZI|nr:glyoxalase-like domain-containing protein [Sphaerosporella brunnea]